MHTQILHPKREKKKNEWIELNRHNEPTHTKNKSNINTQKSHNLFCFPCILTTPPSYSSPLPRPSPHLLPCRSPEKDVDYWSLVCQPPPTGGTFSKPTADPNRHCHRQTPVFFAAQLPRCRRPFVCRPGHCPLPRARPASRHNHHLLTWLASLVLKGKAQILFNWFHRFDS